MDMWKSFWGDLPVHYHVTASFSNATEYKHMHVTEKTNEGRKLSDVHGVLITVQVVGHKYTFDEAALVAMVVVVGYTLYIIIAKTHDLVVFWIHMHGYGSDAHTDVMVKSILSLQDWKEVEVRDVHGNTQALVVPLSRPDPDDDDVTTDQDDDENVMAPLQDGKEVSSTSGGSESSRFLLSWYANEEANEEYSE
jgi:hypothetical protein